MSNTGSNSFAAQLADLLVWGVKRGWQILGRPVNIRLTESGLGYTHAPVRGLPVVINVNPKVLEQERGYQLLQGLILHELGHHFAHFADPDFGRVFTRAKADRLAFLLNIIEDEHLERRLRALNPGWGECFDALVSYAFKGQPMVLLIEQYAALLKMGSVAEVAAALAEGKVPGKISSWEFGYELSGDINRWVSGMELVDLITAALTTAAPHSRLPQLVAEAMATLRRDAGTAWLRAGPQGILTRIQEHKLFELGLGAQESMAKIHITAVLEADEGEENNPGKYMKRMRKKLQPLMEDFPQLGRFLAELETSRGSKWFWHKQRSMLFMMRHNRDFKNAFLPAATMRAGRFRSLFGKEPFHPGVVLAQLIHHWKPRHCESPRHPLKVSVPWLDVLACDFASDDYRFLVSLRLGLGARGAGGSEPVKAALKAVPRTLRKLDMKGLDHVTRAVAALLGECCLDPKPPEPGQIDQPTGSGRVMRELLDRQMNDLSASLMPSEEAAHKKELDEATKEAEVRINEWLTRGVDPEDLGTLNKKDAKRGGVPRGVITIDGSLPRLSGSGHLIGRGVGFDFLNIARSLDFKPIGQLASPPPDPQEYRKLVIPIHGSIRSMRRFLLSLGQGEKEIYGMRQGRRLDPAKVRRLAVLNDPGVAVGRETAELPDLFLGICIDCSGSMVAEDRMDKALSFAALLLEAAKGLKGIEAAALGFEDELLWDVGGPGSTRLAGLRPGGGNNDAGALLAMAKHATLSKKRHRLLVMISDGFPTGCSLESLAGLVRVLKEGYGIRSVQVAVAEMEAERAAFPDFTDLSLHEIPVAVKLFGRMLQRILLKQYT